MASTLITVQGEIVPVSGDELFLALWLDTRQFLASQRSDLSERSRGTDEPRRFQPGANRDREDPDAIASQPLMACAIQTFVTADGPIEWTCSSCKLPFWLSVEDRPKACPLCAATFDEWKELAGS